MLPYLYTLFYDHVTRGSAVFRPLWYNYINDPSTFNIDRQFMWGSGVLVTPVLDEGAVSVTGYFPDNRHYSYYDGLELLARGGNSTLPAPMSFIPVHISGGSIIPTQAPDRNTEAARQNPLGLIVALDDFRNAAGSLFYDDGDSIDTHLRGAYFYAEYAMTGGTLTATTVTNGYPDMGNKVFGNVRLMGYGPVSSVSVDGVPHSSFTTRPSGEVTVTNLNIVANSAFTIVFA